MVSAYGTAAAGILASKVIYDRLLKSMFHSELSFFEKTPSGRILNRHSEDMADVDYSVPFAFRSMINVILQAIANLSMIIYATPLVTTTLPVIGVIYIFIQVLVIN